MKLFITTTSGDAYTADTDDTDVNDARTRALIGGIECPDGTWIAPGQITTIKEVKDA